MSQTAGRPCPTCGNMVPAGQRFCSNCGTALSSVEAPGQYSGAPQQNFPQVQQVPPYAQSPYGQQQSQYQPPYQQPQQKSNPIAEAFGALGLLFFLRRYRPGYTPRRQSSGCCGCLVALVILALIVGIPGYFVYKNAVFKVSPQIQTNGSSNNGSSPSTQQPPTTTQLNETINYGGLDITLLDAQQSSDSSSGTNGKLRLDFKEQAGPRVAAFLYSDSIRLILPDKTALVPATQQFSISPLVGTSRTNWLDFAVSPAVKVDQLILRVGSEKEAQMDIPLSSKANLTAFLPKTVNPNASTHYDGMTWTMSSATLAWSYDGRQAEKGMRCVAVQLSIDNPTSHGFIAGFPGDYMRLKAGDTVSAPLGRTTLPTTIAPNSSGATGVVAFQVPEGVTSFTLILLGNTNANPPYTQATIDFQVK